METKSNTVALVRIGAAVPTDVLDALKEIAKSEDRSVASVIRRAVDREIQEAA